MSGQAFAIIGVGKRRTGKTTHTKTVIDEFLEHDENRDLVVYDVNKEFTEYYDKPFIPFDEFMNSIKDVKNSFIHIEEATIFFTTRSTDRTMISKLVRCRHDNNIISMNFHSWGQVPKEIFALIDFVTIFKTNDSFVTVKGKIDNEKILKAFQKVQKSDNQYEKITVNLNS